MLKFSDLIILPIIVLIYLYKIFLSSYLGFCCRYLPTCSCYSILAYKKYGLITGTILTIKRIISCNPYGGHGYDPVSSNHKKIFF